MTPHHAGPGFDQASISAPWLTPVVVGSCSSYDSLGGPGGSCSTVPHLFRWSNVHHKIQAFCSWIIECGWFQRPQLSPGSTTATCSIFWILLQTSHYCSTLSHYSFPPRTSNSRHLVWFLFLKGVWVVCLAAFCRARTYKTRWETLLFSFLLLDSTAFFAQHYFLCLPDSRWWWESPAPRRVT